MAWCAPQCSKPHLLAPDPSNVLSPFNCYLTVLARATAVPKSAYRGGDLFKSTFWIWLVTGRN